VRFLGLVTYAFVFFLFSVSKHSRSSYELLLVREHPITVVLELQSIFYQSTFNSKNRPILSIAYSFNCSIIQ
jgi:hypothetical protein